MMVSVDTGKRRIDTLPFTYKKRTTADVLRLDLIHPLISGNKWYKLRFYLEQAKQEKKKALLTYGGPWSNHLLATAAACHLEGIRSMAVMPGYPGSESTATMKELTSLGMEIISVTHADYRKKILPETLPEHYSMTDLMIIPQGGHGPTGAAGAATILDGVDLSSYTRIFASVGTGTMLAGLVMASQGIPVTGVSSLKPSIRLEADVNALLPAQLHNQFTIAYGYDQGGFGKTTPALLDFMNRFYESCRIPTDIVYTGKLFMALDTLLDDERYTDQRVLVIHSGGLQGNRSLPEQTLIF